MIKTVYICSSGHSGSTLLDMLIGSHSNIESLGEISHLPKNIALNTMCGCGLAVDECDFWRKVLARVEQQSNINIYSNPYEFDLGYISPKVVIDKNQQTKIYKISRKISHVLLYAYYRFGIPLHIPVVGKFKRSLLNNIKLYQSVLVSSGANMVVDSSKAYLKGLGIYLNNKQETRIILLVRDGRGGFYSNLKRGFDRKKSLDSWINYYNRALPLLDKYVNREHLLVVKYEDIAKDTENVMKRISNFLGVEYQRNMLDFSSKVHHITNGNNARFKSSEIKYDNVWEKNLSDSDLAYFNAHAYRLNKRFGYE